MKCDYCNKEATKHGPIIVPKNKNKKTILYCDDEECVKSFLAQKVPKWAFKKKPTQLLDDVDRYWLMELLDWDENECKKYMEKVN